MSLALRDWGYLHASEGGNSKKLSYIASGNLTQTVTRKAHQ